MAAAVEAVGADLALGQSYGFDEDLESVELQAGESESSAHFLDHSAVLGAVGLCILLQDLIGCGGFSSYAAGSLVAVVLEVVDDLSGEQFHVALGGREVDEGAAVDEWWACDAHVHFLGSEFKEPAHVVVQLGAAHDAVVAEEAALALECILVGDELHLCHQVACQLVAGHEAAGPRGGVF